MSKLHCDDCNMEACLVSGAKIYPHRRDLFHKFFWECATCGRRVGCHPGTHKPLGKLANADERTARSNAHAAFDPLWISGRMKRKAAYAWLADKVGVSVDDCHIGMFTIEQCAKTILACQGAAP